MIIVICFKYLSFTGLKLSRFSERREIRDRRWNVLLTKMQSQDFFYTIWTYVHI